MKRVMLFTSIWICFFCSFAQKISVSFSANTFTGTFTGKVVLYMSKDTPEPMQAMYGIPKLICFSTDAKNIKTGMQVPFAQKISVSFSANTFTGTFTGKVVLYMSKDTPEPMQAMYGIPKKFQ